MNYLFALIIGLIVGVYLTASYPNAIIGGLESIHVPLLGQHGTMTSH